jgi:hypothetical protein
MTEPVPDERELTEAEKRDNVVRLAFNGDPARLDTFVQLIKDFVPENTGVVLRGSAVTGQRWKDGAPFDSDGPGTSDLDLTLVGNKILEYYKVTGFFVPGIHSRPICEGDLDIAPDLLPLREKLMDMVKRPVNIQGTRDFVMYFRGELLGQPYLTLVEKSDTE